MINPLTPREIRRLKKEKQALVEARLNRKRSEDRCRRLYSFMKAFIYLSLIGAAIANVFTIRRLLSHASKALDGEGSDCGAMMLFSKFGYSRCHLVRLNSAVTHGFAVLGCLLLAFLECQVSAVLVRNTLVPREHRWTLLNITDPVCPNRRTCGCSPGHCSRC
jgi:hypothetical protein